MKTALSLLSVASAYADDVGCDTWEFAVGWETLRERMVTANDVRWLVWKGFVDHKTEITPANARRRRFRAASGVVLNSESCFLLTGAGTLYARAMPIEAECVPQCIQGPPRLSANVVPFWDRGCRILYLGDDVVKQFRLPAGNQVLVLAAFQEEGWPSSIDDPLPPSNQIDSKRRLRDTIAKLNRHQRKPLLQFFGNGNGRTVCWKTAIVAAAMRQQTACRQA